MYQRPTRLNPIVIGPFSWATTIHLGDGCHGQGAWSGGTDVAIPNVIDDLKNQRGTIGIYLEISNTFGEII